MVNRIHPKIVLIYKRASLIQNLFLKIISLTLIKIKLILMFIKTLWMILKKRLNLLFNLKTGPWKDKRRQIFVKKTALSSSKSRSLSKRPIMSLNSCKKMNFRINLRMKPTKLLNTLTKEVALTCQDMMIIPI